MEILYDGVLAVFCAIGITTTLWWVASALFDPPKPLPESAYVTLIVSGDGETVSDQLWALRTVQRIVSAPLHIQDGGLTALGKTRIQALCQGENLVFYTNEGEIATHGHTLHL